VIIVASFVGHRVARSTVRVRRQPLRLPLLLLIVWWLIKKVIRVLVVIVRSPVAMATLTAATLTVFGWREVGPPLVGAWYLALVVTVVTVRLRWPAWYEQHVSLVVRSRWRRWSIYRYKWPATMNFADLDRTRSDGTQYRPVLKSVHSTRCVDRVRVRMLAGQIVEDWGKVSDRLCQTFGAEDCRVRSVPGRPHEVELWFLIDDPLRDVVPPHPPESPVRLDGLPVGLREDGEVYRLPLLGNHLVFFGATGAGKSEALWATIYQLVPAVFAGFVQLWGLDPKAMELAAGEPLFERMAYRGPLDYAELLEDGVQVMQERQQVLRGVTRLHTPSVAEPLIVIFIDELAALSYVNERDLRRRIDNALGLLLSQGRAVGVTVVGAIQDPRKDVLPARDLFPVRIALRLTESEQVHLIFSAGARDRGARADQIPSSLPGVAFVLVDGIAEPARVRFAHVTDDQIRALGGARQPRLALVPNSETVA
jgi:S-DNA-T family DNA segregation ATPase FtsK/SpoIIIE